MKEKTLTKNLNEINLEILELKCGIEIHQQLNVGKLFCSCPCKIMANESFNQQIQRKLRFALSETGEIDLAAKAEFEKDKYNLYKFNNKISCLVDLDEEPPHNPNKKAFNTAIRVGQMLNLTFFDKIQFMRKLIIDGSIISGFQRTALLGINGILKTKQGEVKIEGVNLEEDSSRTILREDNHTVFSLDRQGIPLIEITTAPQIRSPIQAQQVALQIGNILRSFPETKRGLGTIRQDLNVSIRGSSRVEIKGTQNLKLIPNIIEAEMIRQKSHLLIINEIKNKKINKDNFSDKKIYNITKLFSNTKSKIILEKLNKKSEILAIKLNKFENILGFQMQENYRFASEISDRNKLHFPKMNGLFHSDELPKYFITQEEVDAIKKKLNMKKNDGFIFICENKKIVEKSLNYIFKIIEELITTTTSHVRKVDPKGILTKFLRPMPGSARMYPETDIENINIENKFLEETKKRIPELYDEKLNRLKKELKLETNKITEIIQIYSEKQIRELIQISEKNSSFIYNILFEIPKDIKKREKIEIFDFKYSLLKDIFKQTSENKINQKIIRDLFISLYKERKTEVLNLENYLKNKNLILEKINEKEIENKIKEIIFKNKIAPFGAIMGLCMKEFKGNIDGKIISSILKKLI